MGRFLVIAAFCLLAHGTTTASAAEPSADREAIDRREFTCPVGGAKFTQDVGFSTYPLVTFPDGSYPGDDRIETEIPICPENGLVLIPDFVAMNAPGTSRMIYSEYSSAELARLPALIGDPAYSALKADGRHVQALWLATRLGRPALVRFMLLQRATWAATDPGLRKRLVERFVAEGPALIEAADMPDHGMRRVRYYIVNALRELGRFDEALALIDSIERGGPPVPAPADPDSLYGPGDYASRMRAVIAAKDMDRFPVALMPDKWAASVCGGEAMPPPYGPPSATTRAACARRATEQARRNAQAESEAESLVDDMEQDQLAGAALAKDGPKLAAACESTPQSERDGPLQSACITYEGLLESALAEAMSKDDSAFAILCPGEGFEHPDDRASSLEVTCDGAVRWRDSLAAERLLADPAALDARCAAVPDRERDGPLGEACQKRSWAIEEAALKRVADDPKAFASRCGRFARALSVPDDYSGTEGDELRYCRRIKDVRDGNGPRPPAEDEDSPAAPNSSLGIEARARAAAIIAKAKAERTYPKRRPGDFD